MQIVQPKTEEELSSYYDFRWRHLREPWNQPRGSEKDDLETESFHLSAKDDSGSIVGVGRIHLNSAEEAQVRYMAVDPNCRGQGVGKHILEKLEVHATDQKASKIVLNARENARGFYERLGYCVTAEGPTMFGEIKHFVMLKDLAGNVTI